MPSSLTRFEEEQEAMLDELKDLVDEFDHLMEYCYTRPLGNEALKELNDIAEALMHIEHSKWRGLSDMDFARLQERLDEKFPMIRYMLGQLPAQPVRLSTLPIHASN
jgi:hypothetical protein